MASTRYVVVSDRCVFGAAGEMVTRNKIDKADGNVKALLRGGHIAPEPVAEPELEETEV